MIRYTRDLSRETPVEDNGLGRGGPEKTGRALRLCRRCDLCEREGKVRALGSKHLRIQCSFKKDLARLIGSFQIKIPNWRYPTSQQNRLP